MRTNVFHFEWSVFLTRFVVGIGRTRQGCILDVDCILSLNNFIQNVTPWSKDWFERELPTVEVKGEGEEVVSISEVTNIDGDVELGQRKSK